MDIKHFYVEKGQGDPIILMHGNGEDCSIFNGQIDVFAQHYHVYALDTRGHGQTPRGDKPFTIRQFADDLMGFMDEHQIEKAHVLGFSDGGNIAMIFAMKIEIGYRIAKLFGGKSDSAKSHMEMLGLMVNDPYVKPEELATIQAKTLVIAGTKDMILESETKRIAENIPDSQLVFVEGDHFIAKKKPEEFNRAVLEFLEE